MLDINSLLCFDIFYYIMSYLLNPFMMSFGEPSSLILMF